MAGHPRYVLTDTEVTWDGATEFVRHGTIVDIADPASPLGLAYGGAANLSAVIVTGDPEDADHAAQGNLGG
jgi:hypothetical protein